MVLAVTQHSTRNMSDAKNKLWGKCLSVFMSVAFAASTVSIAPVASALADEPNGEEQGSVMEEVSTVLTGLQEENTVVMAPQSDVDGEGTEDGTEGTETEGTDEQGEDEIDTQSDDGIEVQSEDGSGAEGGSEEQGQQPEDNAPIVTFKDGTLTVKNVDGLSKDAVKSYLTEHGITQNDVSALNLENVGDIASNAFHSWSKLESVSIKGATGIGERAFNGTSALSSVRIENVDVIGKYVFQDCSKISSLELLKVGTVGHQAFMYCRSLTSLNLSLVGAVDSSAFYGCSGLTEIINIDNPNLTIGNTAFYGCTSLTTLSLDGIACIGDYAFAGCTGLTSATLLNVANISSRVFADYAGSGPCVALETLTLKHVGTVASSIAAGCTSLSTLVIDDATTIGEQAFRDCAGLTNVTIKNVGTVGKNAFYNCSALASVSASNITTLGEYAFNSCKALNVANLENVNSIGQYAFYNCTGLTTVNLTGITNTIGNYAFWNCSALTTVNSLANVSGTIGGFAFYGCSSLTGVEVSDAVKMGYIGSYEEIMDRVAKILAGKFKLEDASEIAELGQDSEWTVYASGKSENWNDYDNGTQITEHARWANAAEGVAEVKVDAYYTGEKQMDYVFVADLSASMAQFGSEEDENARFYDMQSKLLDMTGQLLGTDGYDCRVAIVTFGGMHATETCKTMEFSNDADLVADYINSLEPLNENTDYGLGLKAALGVVQGQDSGRNTVVVFLSDGYPTVNNYTDAHGVNSASLIKKLGVQIYGVLHSPTTAQHADALKIMQEVCGEENVYQANNTESFGKAMNQAFTAVYGNNTITIPVNDEEFVVSDLSATTGEIAYADGVITWTIEGMPFTDHTLNYTLTLREDLRGVVGTHNYYIHGNSSDAIQFAHEGGASIDPSNEENPLMLTRIVVPAGTIEPIDPAPVNPTPETPGDTTPGIDNPVDDQPGATTPAPLPTPDAGALPAVTIPDAATPLAAAPAAPVAAPAAAPAAPVATILDDGNPLAAPEETTIDDDENALISFEEPECQMHWLMSIGLIATLIYGFFVIKRRKDENDEFTAYEHSITHRR